ncbi:CASTOR/POLLUX-related putative ion channel [Marinobacter sp. X15-166B]|uniref:CASTOR/POLLUX-related putative ion channel n=1 Tax=Marinobacter sp. X15-166B TaxID=1897620 RepID=UPI00085BE663|nr:ion channel DMI1 [Marinobacter sp. X15-166B]OEY65692.1 ion channel DMI1 [Marinobacter sp. X15-166B]
MLPLRFVDRVKFMVERQFVKGAMFQLLVVALVIGLIALVGGLLVVPVNDSFADWGAAIWWAFLRLTDPGYLGDDVGTWQRFVSTLLTISGYVVFLGALVAILTRWLIALMTDLERGLTPVALKNHIVVLGWSNQTFPLLAELLGSSGRMRRFLQRHDARRLRLVVLAEEVSAAQVSELKSEPGIGPRARQVILRSGLPIQPDALQRVACLEAAAVIIPRSPHQGDSPVTSDVETVKALLSIAVQARHLGRPLPYVVAEIQDLRKQPLIERAYSGAVEVVAGDALISRLLVQNVLHPGLSELYNELLTAGDGNEIYIRGGEHFTGMTLAEVASLRPNAIVLGVIRHGQVQLACATEGVIASEDRLILMARDYRQTEPQPQLAPLPAVRRAPGVVRGRQGGPQTHRVLVLGWSRRLPSLLAEFDSYAGHSFSVDVVSEKPGGERERSMRRHQYGYRQVEYRHIDADYVMERELRRVNPASYDTILLLSSDHLASGEEADARTIMGYLQLEEVLAESAHRPHLIMELTDPDNRLLLSSDNAEVMISSMILSHVLAQVALRRELRMVLDELFTAGGAELQFRSPEAYPLMPDADFHTLEQTVAAHGEIGLGVLRARPDAAGRSVHLNMDRNRLLNLQPGDQLVVLGLTDPLENPAPLFT